MPECYRLPPAGSPAIIGPRTGPAAGQAGAGCPVILSKSSA